MGIRFHGGRGGRFPRRAAASLWMVLLALGGGCPNFPGTQPPPDNGNDNGPTNGDGDVTAEIISPTTGFGLPALDPPVSILYSVDESATNVRGFRVPVADGSLDSPPIGDRVILPNDLHAGARQVFSFDPGEAGVGFFRVGIVFMLNGTEDDVESRAVIQVQGSPDPIVVQPSLAVTEVAQGTDVFVSFDIRDPEGNVQWRLFYLSESDSLSNPADQLGTVLATGSGNVGTFTLRTAAIPPGDYRLGVSATDSGSSIAVTVAGGESERIVTIPNDTVSTPIVRVVELSVPMPPTIAITAPGATNVSIPSNGSFTIRFTGEVHEPGATGTIEVFYDVNNDVGDGFTTIATDLPVSTTSVAFPTGVLEGAYYIGATISDGINPTVTVYAGGKLSVTPG